MQFIINILLLGSLGILHPIHISVTNIEYIENEKNFIVAVKIFTDDLESVINKKYNIELNLGKSNENTEYKKYLDKYIKEHFKFIINKKVNITNQMLFDLLEISVENVMLRKIQSEG